MIKVVGLDIYGTVLSSTDHDNCMPPRRGIEKFFDTCDAEGIIIASCSDANILCVEIDLGDSGVDTSRFNRFFCLNQLPVKDFNSVLEHYKIAPEELLVIGDNPIKDIGGARKIGAKSLLVDQYQDRLDGFDFSKIDIDVYRR